MINGGFVYFWLRTRQLRWWKWNFSTHKVLRLPLHTPTDFDDKLEVPVSQILTLVDPKCPTGRTYYMCKEEMDAATAALKNYLARDSWTCYKIKTSDDHPLPHFRYVYFATAVVMFFALKQQCFLSKQI